MALGTQHSALLHAYGTFIRARNGFVWDAEKLPLTHTRYLAIVPAAYVAVVLALRFALGGKAVPLGPLPVLHNIVLVVWSLAMFGGMAYEAVLYTLEHEGSDPTWLFCLPPGTVATGRLYFWPYIYYLSKFYELLDTVLRVLKAQPLTFLHVFHHAAVLWMAWLWLEHAQSLQAVALLTNTGIHIVMYSYYLLCSFGIKPTWKKLVTNGQVIQFVFSFACCVPFLVLHYRQGCQGFRAWAFNAAFNAALLLLFVDFHRRSYKQGGAAGKGKGAAGLSAGKARRD